MKLQTVFTVLLAAAGLTFWLVYTNLNVTPIHLSEVSLAIVETKPAKPLAHFPVIKQDSVFFYDLWIVYIDRLGFCGF